MVPEHLETRFGFASVAGRRLSNDDFVAARLANESALGELVAVVADGVGASPGGRLASETTARGFLDGYLDQPPTLGVERAAARSLNSINRWLHAHGLQRGGERLATTFTGLIVRGRSAHVVHVGDTRLYRLRGERLEQLTQDHNHPHPDLTHVLVRAVGLEESVRADYAAYPLEPHDRFLLCSDGVHNTLGATRLRALLAQRTAPQEDAERLVHAALDAGSQDNLTALVLDVLRLPPSDHREIYSALERLPIHELPKPGETIDDYRLQECISDGRYSRLFRAADQRRGRDVVLKFPHPRVAHEATYRRAFAREAWVAQQVQSPFVTEVLEPEPGRRTRLYLVLPFYRGETLEQRLRRKPAVSLAEGVDVGIKLAKAVYAINRRRIVHRDIKPENVLLSEPAVGAERGLRLLDLGVARLPGVDEDAAMEIPGTPSYMAPELFGGHAGDERSDTFAVGVTLYRLWSGGRYPYGEIEAFSSPRFHRRTPLMRYRPDLPAWVDDVLARALAVDSAKRFADAMELAFELENGLAKGAPRPQRPVPLYERSPLRFWQFVSALLAVALVLSWVFR
jgi:serine/threonine protein phosphatase PrpC